MLLLLLLLINGVAILRSIQIQISQKRLLLVPIGVEPLTLFALGAEAAIFEALPWVQVTDAGMAYVKREAIQCRDLQKKNKNNSNIVSYKINNYQT